jgi:hypothetical protein
MNLNRHSHRNRRGDTPVQASALQPFDRVFAEVKSRLDDRPSVRDGLTCKQGFHMNSVVLKLQKASWTNDPMNQIQNQSGIFFSIWINEKSASKGRANYNIHALKLRNLKRYSITSRDFAEEFRDRFASLQGAWPNLSLKYGPLTLMQGWIGISPNTAAEDILALMERFERLSPLIDRLLESRRR